jgi:hypothetical protein
MLNTKFGIAWSVPIQLSNCWFQFPGSKLKVVVLGGYSLLRYNGLPMAHQLCPRFTHLLLAFCQNLLQCD